MNSTDSKTTRSLTTPTIDFMLLGGASLYVWIIMVGISIFVKDETGKNYFYLATMFGWLSILCNYPHFLVSYRFGYGRGKKFILKNWAALILVPVLMVLVYVIAYLFFNEPIKYHQSTVWINHVFKTIGMDFQLGILPNFGAEVINFSVRLMFVTSAWHYAKQAFGCIMVFSHYHNYPLSKFQRNLWKFSLYSVGIYNFFFIANLMYSQTGLFSEYRDIRIMNSSYPTYMSFFSLGLVCVLGIAVIYFILFKNYKDHKIRPTSSMLIPWIALHFWWIPFLDFSNYFLFLAVPFFHSLQYLLFAYQLEAPDHKREKLARLKIMIFKILILFLVGYLSFEYIPEYLDSTFSTYRNFHGAFFLTAIPVFINIHHFFIDSVVWRFNDEEIREKLLN